MQQLGEEPRHRQLWWESLKMKMMGKELAVSMETDSGRMKHGPMGNPRGECHPPPGFHCGRQAGTSGSAVSAMFVGSVHLCLHSLRDITIWQCACQVTSISEGPGEIPPNQKRLGMAPDTLLAVPGKSMVQCQAMGL